jgi:hypothetical protein
MIVGMEHDKAVKVAGCQLRTDGTWHVDRKPAGAAFVGRCRICGKTLKDAISIERGVSAECVKKIITCSWSNWRRMQQEVRQAEIALLDAHKLHEDDSEIVALCDLMEEVQLDAKQRKFIWPDGRWLDLDQSVQHTQKQYPDFRRDWIEEYLIDWIDMDYAPEHYSQAQLDELDRLTAQWIADHMPRAKSSKRQGRTL